MNPVSKSDEHISDVRASFQLDNSKLSYVNEEPLRAELLSTEQLERYGKVLAEAHELNTKSTKDHLLKRLADNEIVLQEVRKLLTESIKKKYQITPAGEWLIDNFYLIEEHIRNAKINFPKDYSEGLPQLLNVSSEGVTRIYDIVLQIISHSDGRIDIESLSSFLKAYQTVTYLRLGELWAIPIMLRLALIENLRRVAAHIAIDRVNGNLADYWGGKMIETSEKDPKNLILIIADMARSKPPMVGAFVAELIRQLRGKGPDLALSLNWIEQQLAENGLTSTELVDAEIQKQAANQVSMSNSIGSLRLLGSTDWREFVEEHSIVEQTLRKDINGVYGSMDFSTRDAVREQNIDTQAAEKCTGINALKLFKTLETKLHDNAILVADGGDFVATAAYTLRPSAPLSWLDPGVFGTLGVGAGFALGAKLVFPEKDVFIIWGDGSSGYSLMEYDTFVRHKLPVISVIGNDACWTQIARDQVEFLNSSCAVNLAHSNYEMIGKAFGADGKRVETLEEFSTAVDEAKQSSKNGIPYIINAIIGKSEFRKGSISM